jgi:hypothetical protein
MFTLAVPGGFTIHLSAAQLRRAASTALAAVTQLGGVLHVLRLSSAPLKDRQRHCRVCLREDQDAQERINDPFLSSVQFFLAS